MQLQCEIHCNVSMGLASLGAREGLLILSVRLLAFPERSLGLLLHYLRPSGFSQLLLVCSLGLVQSATCEKKVATPVWGF